MDEQQYFVIKVTSEVPFRGTLTEAQNFVRRIKDAGGKAALGHDQVMSVITEVPVHPFPDKLDQLTVRRFIKFVFRSNPGHEEFEGLRQHFSAPDTQREALDHLDNRERTVLMMLAFGEYPCTAKEVGKAVGISKERVHQIAARAASKIRHPRLMEMY